MADLKNMPQAEIERRRTRAYNGRTLVGLMARRRAIIKELSDLSRGGWANARSCDWEPLERELAVLNARRAELEAA